MKYRRLGKTELMVSEVGFGAEWLERHNEKDCVELIKYAEANGINILDCWMSNPEVRRNIGLGIKDSREKWFIQGHIGSTWQNEQYVKTRDMKFVKRDFEDLFVQMQTDYIDLGMIHYVDELKDWEYIQNSDYLEYVFELRKSGRIRHIGLSTHNPEIAIRAAKCGYVEMIMFSVNPAFDLLPAIEDLTSYLNDEFDGFSEKITDERKEVYKTCLENDVGITVMKPYFGGRLLDEKRSPFGVALTPAQCISYCLSLPSVCSVMAGYDYISHIDDALKFETQTEEENDYSVVLANAPRHAYAGQCTYCGHCKPCPVNIDIALVNKFYDLATINDSVPESVREHYNDLEVKASECLECHSCESRCPFGVKIAQRMALAVKLFEEV